MVSARAYNFSGNYDCDTCGRVNCDHAVMILWGNRFIAEFCSECVHELALPEWEQAYNQVVSEE